MNKILTRLLFCAIFAIVPVFVLTSAWGGRDAREALSGIGIGGSTLPVGVESFIRLGFPFRSELSRIGLDVGMAGGQREVIRQDYGYPARQNGIFVGEGSLMKNIDPPVEHYVDENISGITVFAESMRQNRKQVYLMLIPTSGAIMQQNLPRFAQAAMVNQRRFIEDAYGRVSESMTTIDVYSALIGRQNQYIYYRTENNLTPLGGYYVYSAMLSRLGMGRMELGRFDIDYVNTSFYGDLYEESGYTDVPADTISLYRYSGSNRSPHEFLVTHTLDGGVKTYHTLFPGHATDLGSELDIFLGGLSSVTDIRSNSQYATGILVFGDKTAASYLPFLANSCERVTFVDLSSDHRLFASIDPLDYDKVIFAYGVEVFMHTNDPSRVYSFLEKLE